MLKSPRRFRRFAAAVVVLALPAASVGAVHSTGAFRVGQVKHGRALLVLDHQKRTLLRASGLCESYGEVAAFYHEKRRSRSSGLLPAWLSKCGKREVFRMTPEIPAAVAWNLFRVRRCS
jgi:hypothetical protein